MSNCYLPVIEKFKRKNLLTWNSDKLNHEINTLNNNHYANVRCASVPPKMDQIQESAPVPKRDSQGFTITHELGSFPNKFPLNIRHNNPTLGLNDVAYQRIHQTHSMHPHQYEKLQRQIQRYSNPKRPSARPPSVDSGPPPYTSPSPSTKGVLSLGLPDKLNPQTLFRKSRPNTPEPFVKPTTIIRKTKMPTSFNPVGLSSGYKSDSELINSTFNTYEELMSEDDEINRSKSSSSSGHSSASGEQHYTLPVNPVLQSVNPPSRKLHPSLKPIGKTLLLIYIL